MDKIHCCNNTIVDSLHAASNKRIGLYFGASVFKVTAQQKLSYYTTCQDYDNGGGIFYFFWGNDFFDTLNKNMDTNYDNNASNK